MSARRFDAKCGEHPLEELPRSPGVYEWLGPDGQTLYVGKAKNLRNRLRQYRNVSRRKAHRKMQALVGGPTLPVVRALITEILTAHFFVTRPHNLRTMQKLADIDLRI